MVAAGELCCLSDNSGYFISCCPMKVVGIPDERLGEEIYACVQLKDGQTVTQDDIKQFCKEKVSAYVLYANSALLYINTGNCCKQLQTLEGLVESKWQ